MDNVQQNDICPMEVYVVTIRPNETGSETWRMACFKIIPVLPWDIIIILVRGGVFPDDTEFAVFLASMQISHTAQTKPFLW
jgi:hypothetical protein